MSESVDDERLIAEGLYLARLYEPRGAISHAERALLALARRHDCSATLGRNLAIAGALCQAFADGLDEAEGHGLYHKFGYRAAECWRPNAAGRPAPSAERDEP